MRLKEKDADRFDFKSSAGEVTREISLKEKISETPEGLAMLTDALAMKWDSFLCWDDPSGKDLETNLSIFTRKLLTVLLELSKAERSVEHNQVAADCEAYHKSCFRCSHGQWHHE